jgi:hypothetical protein
MISARFTYDSGDFAHRYPSIPPLVHFETTGGGTVKFNPNLYADGKVCLSLIGTFSGANATEKWDPALSTLYQVPTLTLIEHLTLTPTHQPLALTLPLALSTLYTYTPYIYTYQVLMGIQSQILTENPIVNEPSYDEIASHLVSRRG